MSRTDIVIGKALDNQGNGQELAAVQDATEDAIKTGYDYISYSNVKGAKQGAEILTVILNDSDGEAAKRLDIIL
jgi:hypothetical protein